MFFFPCLDQMLAVKDAHIFSPCCYNHLCTGTCSFPAANISATDLNQNVVSHLSVYLQKNKQTSPFLFSQVLASWFFLLLLLVWTRGNIYQTGTMCVHLLKSVHLKWLFLNLLCLQVTLIKVKNNRKNERVLFLLHCNS